MEESLPPLGIHIEDPGDSPDEGEPEEPELV